MNRQKRSGPLEAATRTPLLIGEEQSNSVLNLITLFATCGLSPRAVRLSVPCTLWLAVRGPTAPNKKTHENSCLPVCRVFSSGAPLELAGTPSLWTVSPCSVDTPELTQSSSSLGTSPEYLLLSAIYNRHLKINLNPPSQFAHRTSSGGQRNSLTGKAEPREKNLVDLWIPSATFREVLLVSFLFLLF